MFWITELLKKMKGQTFILIQVVYNTVYSSQDQVLKVNVLFNINIVDKTLCFKLRSKREIKYIGYCTPYQKKKHNRTF